MSESSERKIREFKIWQFIDTSLIKNKYIYQNEIVNFASISNLGSKKTILSIISSFTKSNLIIEVDMTQDSRGRPKKAYTRIDDIEMESTLLNIGKLPLKIRDFITKEAEKSQIGKNEVIVQLLNWVYFELQHPNYSLLLEKPVNIPSYLNDVYQ